jgi:hypothetical protein
VQGVDEHVYSLVECKGVVVLDRLKVVTLGLTIGFIMSESGLDVLSVERDLMGVVGAFAVLFIDGKVDYLDNAWKIGPAVIVNISILLQSSLRVGLEETIILDLFEAITDLIGILYFLED